MQAKAFLQQLQKIEKLIENKTYERDFWKNKAIETTSKLSADKVTTTIQPQKTANAIDKYIDLEREISQQIDDLINKRREILSVIEQLKNPNHYDILHKIYVQYLTLDDVALLYQKTYSWVTTTHGNALKMVQKIIDKEGI